MINNIMNMMFFHIIKTHPNINQTLLHDALFDTLIVNKIFDALDLVFETVGYFDERND